MTRTEGRGANVNTIIKTHEHFLQHNIVLKELFRTNSFIVVNETAKNLRELVAHADPHSIKTDLLNQHGFRYKNVDVTATLAIILFLRKDVLYILLQELNLRFVGIAHVI